MLLLSALLALAATVPAAALERRTTTPTYIFSFGDSYSTTSFWVNGTRPSCSGNLIGNPTFPGTTTTGGKNWIGELVDIAPSCALSYNFAYYGATVDFNIVSTISSGIPSFVGQVYEWLYTLGKKPSYAPWTAANSAFVVWFGVNDVDNSFRKTNRAAVQSEDRAEYFSQLDVLYNAGARKFLLLSTPPTYRTPIYLSNTAAIQESLSTSVTSWNYHLTLDAATWAASHPNSNVQVLHTWNVFTPILNDPTAYGAPDATCYNANGKSCLWWNSYHPGLAIQAALGKAVLAKLQTMGLFA